MHISMESHTAYGEDVSINKNITEKNSFSILMNSFFILQSIFFVIIYIHVTVQHLDEIVVD